MKIETENHQRKTKQFKLFKNIYKIHKTLLSLTEKERVDQLLISKKKKVIHHCGLMDIIRIIKYCGQLFTI